MSELSANDCLEMLDAYSASLNLQYPRWLGGDNADAGPSYCQQCAEHAVGQGRGEYVDGGFPQEADGYESCYQCNCMLEYSLTDYGAKSEFAHFSNRRFKSIDRETAYQVARILDADRSNEQYLKLARRACKRLPNKSRIEKEANK